MSIFNQEQELFSRWRQERVCLVEDGVVCESSYLNSPMKICFVLKEVNDPEGGGWDLRKFLLKGGRPRTWNNITRWIHAIRHLEFVPNWSEYENVSAEFRVELLRSICAFNLKKSPGSHTTHRASFDQAVTADKSFIKEQFSFYDPDLTICCGTGWAFRNSIELNDVPLKETSRGIKWFNLESGKPVIMFSHPEARVQDSLLLYGLTDAVKEILG